MRFLSLQISFRIVSPSSFPKNNIHLSSIVRGALQAAAVRTFCHTPEERSGKACATCTCLLSQVFDTAYPAEHPRARMQPPAPYVIHAQAQHLKSNNLVFDWLLFGEQAAETLPDILLCLRTAGAYTLGAEQGLVLQRLEQRLPSGKLHTLYFEGQIKGLPLQLHLNDYLAPLPDTLPTRVVVHFRTLSALSKDNTLATQAPDFNHLLWHIIQRRNLLLDAYGDTPLLDAKPPAHPETDIQLVMVEIPEVSAWKKTQRRQTLPKTLQVLGFEGKATYEGNITPEIWQLLQIGQTIHIGQLTSFGCGRFSVKEQLIAAQPTESTT